MHALLTLLNKYWVFVAVFVFFICKIQQTWYKVPCYFCHRCLAHSGAIADLKFLVYITRAQTHDHFLHMW